MENRFSRSRLLIGDEALKKLFSSKIAIFGLGGVGSFAAEAVARAGVGAISLFDGDVVNQTDINRQLVADSTTIGEYKTEVTKKRISNINPDAAVETVPVFYDSSNYEKYDLSKFDYIIDAIDSVQDKLRIVCEAEKHGVKIVSCMGTAERLDPLSLRTADIHETSTCPLARIMRKELRKLGIPRLKVVYSTEKPVKRIAEGEQLQSNENGGPVKRVLGSVSFVPSVAGLIAAGTAIKDLMGVYGAAAVSTPAARGHTAAKTP